MHIFCTNCPYSPHSYPHCGCIYKKPIYLCVRADDWDEKDVLSAFSRLEDAIAFQSPYGYKVVAIDVDSWGVYNDE